PPSQIARFIVGQSAEYILPPGTPHSEREPPEGKVVFTAYQAQPDTGSYLVKARFANPELFQRANAVVRIRIQTKPKKKRLVVPDTVLLEDRDPPQVIVIEDIKEEEKEGKKEKVGKVRFLRVELGVRNREESKSEILRLIDPEDDQKAVPALDE